MSLKKILSAILDPSYLILLFSTVLTVLVVTSIYNQNQHILKDTLRERLIAILSTGVLQFNPDEVNVIKNENDLHSKELRNVINTMNRIRSANKNLRYIYIWRKTNDPKYLEFVADAEMLEPIDVDGNGKIEGDEVPPLPGEKYAVDQIPQSEKIFDAPVAQYDFIVDKWGTFLSGSAPIRDKSGNPIAVLGVDVEVSDFYKIIRATFLPFLLLTIVLLSLLTIQTIALIRIWRNRVFVVQDLDRQKDELLGMVSHQLAKPITAIKWNLESMIDGDIGALTPEQKESAGTMQSMATNLADLVSMILDVSRIQLGKVKLDPQPLDLNEFFREIVSVVEPTIKEKKISFVQDIYPQKLPTVLLDKRYTRMTIENLLTNAIKYTPEGGTVKLWVQVTNNTLHCSVSDTGCGIPKAEQDKIFGKMFRASNVRNTMDGNGFGLYVAKGAVEGQGGRIWFQSIEGKGTTFFVDLPAKDAVS